MKLYEKSRVYNLYACTTSDCRVMSFIKTDVCPVCQKKGVILRFSDTFDHPQSDARDRSYTDAD